MKRNVLIAVLIAVAAAVWLGFGALAGNSEPATHDTLATIKENADQLMDDAPPTVVRAKKSIGQLQPEYVILRGKTRNKRTVVVRAEVTGKVIKTDFERGDRVRQGDPLCVMDPAEHQVRVREAEDRLKEAELVLEGRQRLIAKNLNSEVDIAAAQSAVTSAERYLTETKMDLERATIRAPFDGYVELVQAFEGDLLNNGAPCGTILDLDPMIIETRVPEDVVHRLKPGMRANASLPSGRQVSGTVSFLGRDSEATTRTFALELTLPNPDYSVRSGLTAEMTVEIDRRIAHKINSSLFSLDDKGVLGINLVDDRNQVRFYPIDIVREESDGVWVTGLPDIATIITVGHRFVGEGQTVTLDLES